MPTPPALSDDAIHAHRLSPAAGMPNNPDLPLLVYRQALPGEAASEVEARLAANGWGGVWIDGVFGYHHFHSNAHEAMVVVAGEATLILGGENGLELRVAPGDVLVLPAGTGHCKREASADFRVVGAYPPGQEDWDVRTDRAEVADVEAKIARVPLPNADPIFGGVGPLRAHWHGGEAAVPAGDHTPTERRDLQR